ncbi:hypothetical protein MHYP_G00076670 [Metynnis hypsauchen]
MSFNGGVPHSVADSFSRRFSTPGLVVWPPQKLNEGTSFITAGIFKDARVLELFTVSVLKLLKALQCCAGTSSQRRCRLLPRQRCNWA